MNARRMAAYIVFGVFTLMAIGTLVAGAISGHNRGDLVVDSSAELTPEEAEWLAQAQAEAELAAAETAAGTAEVAETQAEVIPLSTNVVEEWWHFYNGDLNHDDNEEAWNFGPDPMAENAFDGLGDLLSERGIKGSVSIEEIYDLIDTDVLNADFRDRMRNDPALGAACMAWFDSIMGTRYLGWFYDQVEGRWDYAMNYAKQLWMEDRDSYNETLDSFYEFLNMAVSVKVEKSKIMSDQMYMNPFTGSDAPDIIVMESPDHEGWFLVYNFEIKGTGKKSVRYRLNCGYQPTDVAETMKVTPQKNPNGGRKSSTGSGGGGGGGTGGSGGGKTTLSNPKDKTKGTSVLPNDTTGPGPDTNNGVGAQYSKEDKPDSSNHMTQSQYWEWVDDMADINATQRTGGDSNTPSTPAPSSDTKVDNNAQNGNGNGGIDKATPVTGGAETTSGHKVTDDKAGVAWDGPPD